MHYKLGPTEAEQLEVAICDLKFFSLVVLGL